MANITDNFQVEGFVEQKKELEKLMMSNPAMEKKVQGLIRKVLGEVRKAVMAAAQQPSVMKTDPRQAYKAVKMAVYKRILGGNVSILRKKRAIGGGTYTPTRTLRTGQRGGNRRLRSERTMKLESYVGNERGFILRFLNAGTQIRMTRYGNRGAIAPRNFFGNRSHLEMEQAAKNLETLIDNLIKQEIA